MRPEAGPSSILRITLNLAVASLLAGVVVAGAHALTQPRIELNRKAQSEETMRRLVPAASEFIPAAGGNFEARSAKGLEGYVLPAQGRGYGGTIKILAAEAPDGSLLGFEILSHNETPGLGDRATEASFRDRFKGRSRGNLAITTTGEAGKIDALSGATITSRAVAAALDEALASAPAGLPGGAR
jgi:Na+-translocating ferredoxin:NAD+ oxidoreductase subunit G